MKKTIALSCSVLAALTLGGCGGGSDTADNTNSVPTTVVGARTLTITPVLGKTLNAEVTIESLDKTFSKSGNTAANGNITFNIPDNIEVVIVSVKGDAASKYLEEANDFKEEGLPVGETLRAAVVLSGQSQQDIAVTALTEAAARYAEKQGFSNTTINNGNLLIGKAFGIPNILRKPIIMTSNSAYATLPTDSTNLNASRYSILLAALAKVAADASGTSTQASLKFARQLASDFEDGDIDQKGPAYDANTLQSKINQVVAALPVSTLLKSAFTITIAKARILTITPMLGQTFNTDITIESLDKSFSASANTLSNGSVSFSIPDDVQTVVVSAKGNADSTYLEAANDFQTDIFPSGEILRAGVILSSADQQDIAITTLTEAALRYAQQLGLTSNSIRLSNQLVGTTFGITDILRTPSTLRNTGDYVTLPTSEAELAASRYAVLLAGLAQTAAGKSGTKIQASLAFSHQLANDFINGDISQNGISYNASTLQNQVNQAVAALPLNAALKNAFTITTVSNPDNPDNPGNPDNPDTPTNPDGYSYITKAGPESLTPYLGTYLGNQCTLTFSANGVITFTTASINALLSLNGESNDIVVKQNGMITALFAGDVSQPTALYSIAFANGLPKTMQYQNQGVTICTNLVKSP